MQIIFEDNHLIAVNKECGEIVMVDQTGDAPLTDQVKAYIKEKYDKPGNVFLGLPHRIDRPTSGIVLMARTSKVLTRLNKMFQQKDQIRKIYWAVVDKRPVPSEGTLEHYITRSRDVNKSYAHNEEVEGSKYAFLAYKTIAKSDRFFLLEIELHTARHHQIRAQFAAVGWPIRGDLKYGARRSSPSGRIMLHGYRIEFDHPRSGERMTFTAPLPRDETLWTLLADFLAGETAH